MKTSQLEELYRLISAPIVRYPDDLLIHAQSTVAACNVVIACNPGDQGRLIGAGGRMYKACDNLLRTAGLRIGLNARLIIESDCVETHELRPFKPKTNWTKIDNEYLEALFEDVLGYVWDAPYTVHASDVSKHGTVVLMRTQEALTENLRLSFETVVNAVGKAKGRFVYLDVGRLVYEGQNENISARRAHTR